MVVLPDTVPALTDPGGEFGVVDTAEYRIDAIENRRARAVRSAQRLDGDMAGTIAIDDLLEQTRVAASPAVDGLFDITHVKKGAGPIG